MRGVCLFLCLLHGFGVDVAIITGCNSYVICFVVCKWSVDSRNGGRRATKPSPSPSENACDSNGARLMDMCVYRWTGISGGNLLLLSDHDALTEEVLH